jgi:hypothetical protein
MKVPDESVSAGGCKAATARVFRSGKVCTSCRESLLRPDCLRRRTRRSRRSQDDQVCPVQAGSPRPRTSAQSAGQYLIDALRGRIEAGPDRRPRWATPTDDQAGTGRPHSAAPRKNSVPLRGCPLGAHPIGRDVRSCEWGVPRASFSSQSTHPHLAHLGLAPDAQCAPRVSGFWVQCGRRQLRLHHGLAREGPANEDEKRKVQVDKSDHHRVGIEWASSGPCANGALGCSLWYRPPSSRRDAGQRSRSCA